MHVQLPCGRLRVTGGTLSQLKVIGHARKGYQPYMGNGLQDKTIRATKQARLTQCQNVFGNFSFVFIRAV
jgi:hypothetical protein